MRVVLVLFILISIEAKRKPESGVVNNRRTNIEDVDVYPERFSDAVDFGHVYRDNRKQMKSVQSDIVEPRSVEHARQLLRKFGSDLKNLRKPVTPAGFASARDAILYNERFKTTKNETKNKQTERIHKPQRVRNTTQSLRKAVEDEINKKYPVHRDPTPLPPSDGVFSGTGPEDIYDKSQYFSKFSFDLSQNEIKDTKNWTTCKEFAKGAVFHPDDVVNLQWVPFYIWSTDHFVTSVVHTLTYPTKKRVNQYKELFGPYLNMRLDWEQPKLLLKETKEMLLIAGDRKGLFYGIPHTELPNPIKNYKIKITVVILRLKIMDPYLAMMYCGANYATIMCISGNEPETDEEKTAEASFLKFRGTGNPASRDLELEAHMTKFEIEKKRRDEERKFIRVEKPDDRLDPSLW